MREHAVWLPPCVDDVPKFSELTKWMKEGPVSADLHRYFSVLYLVSKFGVTR